jgi:hypothetical protein
VVHEDHEVGDATGEAHLVGHAQHGLRCSAGRHQEVGQDQDAVDLGVPPYGMTDVAPQGEAMRISTFLNIS